VLSVTAASATPVSITEAFKQIQAILEQGLQGTHSNFARSRRPITTAQPDSWQWRQVSGIGTWPQSNICPMCPSPILE